jgi:NAD(P)-dependent dehydrogenase (short-subunit alcohol dehydrogenase family)
MAFNLSGKTALVTGGGSGIGKAICRVLALAGTHVHILDLDPEASQIAVDEIAGQNRNINLSAHGCNVADQEQVIACVAAIRKEASIDILVNNAGIAHIGSIEDTSPEDLDRLYQVNIKGVYNCARACIPGMKDTGGVIVNMASVAGTVGISDRFAYSMTKGAVLTMTYSLAKDYIAYGIRCNSVSPARIHTPFVDGYLSKNYPGREKEMYGKLSKTQPIGRMGTPDEVAHLVLYLCSDEAAFVTGTDFPIDGGFIRLNG